MTSRSDSSLPATLEMTAYDGKVLRVAAAITGHSAYAALAEMAPAPQLGRLSRGVPVEVSPALRRDVCAAPQPGVGALMDADNLVDMPKIRDADEVMEAFDRAREAWSRLDWIKVQLGVDFD